MARRESRPAPPTNGGPSYEVTLPCDGIGGGRRAESCEKQVTVTRQRDQEYEDLPYVCNECAWTRDFERRAGRRTE